MRQPPSNADLTSPFSGGAARPPQRLVRALPDGTALSMAGGAHCQSVLRAPHPTLAMHSRSRKGIKRRALTPVSQTLLVQVPAGLLALSFEPGQFGRVAEQGIDFSVLVQSACVWSRPHRQQRAV